MRRELGQNNLETLTQLVLQGEINLEEATANSELMDLLKSKQKERADSANSLFTELSKMARNYKKEKGIKKIEWGDIDESDFQKKLEKWKNLTSINRQFETKDGKTFVKQTETFESGLSEQEQDWFENEKPRAENLDTELSSTEKKWFKKGEVLEAYNKFHFSKEAIERLDQLLDLLEQISKLVEGNKSLTFTLNEIEVLNSKGDIVNLIGQEKFDEIRSGLEPENQQVLDKILKNIQQTSLELLQTLKIYSDDSFEPEEETTNVLPFVKQESPTTPQTAKKSLGGLRRVAAALLVTLGIGSVTQPAESKQEQTTPQQTTSSSVEEAVDWVNQSQTRIDALRIALEKYRKEQEAKARKRAYEQAKKRKKIIKKEKTNDTQDIDVLSGAAEYVSDQPVADYPELESLITLMREAQEKQEMAIKKSARGQKQPPKEGIGVLEITEPVEIVGSIRDGKTRLPVPPRGVADLGERETSIPPEQEQPKTIDFGIEYAVDTRREKKPELQSEKTDSIPQAPDSPEISRFTISEQRVWQGYNTAVENLEKKLGTDLNNLENSEFLADLKTSKDLTQVLGALNTAVRWSEAALAQLSPDKHGEERTIIEQNLEIFKKALAELREKKSREQTREIRAEKADVEALRLAIEEVWRLTLPEFETGNNSETELRKFNSVLPVIFDSFNTDMGNVPKISDALKRIKTLALSIGQKLREQGVKSEDPQMKKLVEILQSAERSIRALETGDDSFDLSRLDNPETIDEKQKRGSGRRAKIVLPKPVRPGVALPGDVARTDMSGDRHDRTFALRKPATQATNDLGPNVGGKDPLQREEEPFDVDALLKRVIEARKRAKGETKKP